MPRSGSRWWSTFSAYSLRRGYSSAKAVCAAKLAGHIVPLDMLNSRTISLPDGIRTRARIRRW
jgi:hypothetical protein